MIKMKKIQQGAPDGCKSDKSTCDVQDNWETSLNRVAGIYDKIGFLGSQIDMLKNKIVGPTVDEPGNEVCCQNEGGKSGYIDEIFTLCGYIEYRLDVINEDIEKLMKGY